MKTGRNLIVERETKDVTKCFSWTAIFAGALVGVGLSFLLNLFSLAIGVSAFATAQDGTTALAVGGLTALALSTIIAMFLAGMTAGALGRAAHGDSSHCHMGSLYGFATWTLTLIISVMLAMHMGHFISYTTSKLAHPNAPMVKMHENRDNLTVSATSASGTEDAAQMTVNEDQAAHGFATAAFITFILFLVGAISACFGAHCGFKCCSRKNTACNI